MLETRCLLVASQELHDTANFHEFRSFFSPILPNSLIFSLTTSLVVVCSTVLIFFLHHFDLHFFAFFFLLQSPCITPYIFPKQCLQRWYFKPSFPSKHTELLIIFLNLIRFFFCLPAPRTPSHSVHTLTLPWRCVCSVCFSTLTSDGWPCVSTHWSFPKYNAWNHTNRKLQWTSKNNSLAFDPQLHTHTHHV